MSAWTDFEASFEEFFTDAEKDVLAFFGASAKAIVASGGQLLILAATQAVQTAEATGGDGAAKLAAAQAGVIGTLESQGIAVVLGAVNAGIEAAVAQMKANAAPAT